MKKTAFLFIVALGLAACQSEAEPGKTPAPAKEYPAEEAPGKKALYEAGLTEAEQRIAGRTNEFTFDLLRKVTISGETPGRNVLLSPLSAALALAMLDNGAAGQTREEIHQLLGYAEASTEELNAYFQKMIALMQEAGPDVTFESANSIWIDEAFPVLNSFVETNALYYQAEARNANLSDEATASLINAWASEKTQGKIANLLSQPPGGALALINALYFKGAWTLPFDKEETKDEVFYNQDGTAPLLPTMNKKGLFNYLEAAHFKLLDLPYGNEQFSMSLLLPGEGVSLDEALEGLDAEKWDGYIGRLSGCELPVKLPRFRLEYERELLDDLKAMGLRLETPDFSLIHPTAPLDISKVLQKTFVDVAEEGTEAAGVTVVFLTGADLNAPAPAPPSFYADRPFAFFIREKTTGVIFFSGAIRNL
jgi:serpin B